MQYKMWVEGGESSQETFLLSWRATEAGGRRLGGEPEARGDVEESRRRWAGCCVRCTNPDYMNPVYLLVPATKTRTSLRHPAATHLIKVITWSWSLELVSSISGITHQRQLDWSRLLPVINQWIYKKVHSASIRRSIMSFNEAKILSSKQVRLQKLTKHNQITN